MFSRDIQQGERGAALVIVLLFMVVVFALVTAMLVRSGSEIVISGLHRDGTRAMELAQSGLEETVRRLEVGRNTSAASLSDVVVRVIPRELGVGGALIEIQADATVGRAKRYLSLLVLQIAEEMVPNITFGRHYHSGGSATVEEGDVYSQTFVRYKQLPSDPGSETFAGWRISKEAPNAISYCYERTGSNPCSGQSKWYPGTRRAAYEDEALSATDLRKPIDELDFACPGGPSNPQVKDAGLGWQSTDVRHDKTPGDTAGNAMLGTEPLYACDPNDNLPYTWVREQVVASDQSGQPTTYNMWFKVIAFEKWRDEYWEFDQDGLGWKLKSTFDPNQGHGAVPPPPPFARLKGRYDRLDNDGNVNNADDFGTCANPNPANTPICDSTNSKPMIVLLDTGNSGVTWNVAANITGHGTLLVNGKLRVTGNLTYYGTIIVNGEIEIASGNATIYGGLVGNAKVEPSGSLKLFSGDIAASVPVGGSTVVRRAWFER